MRVLIKFSPVRVTSRRARSRSRQRLKSGLGLGFRVFIGLSGGRFVHGIQGSGLLFDLKSWVDSPMFLSPPWRPGNPPKGSLSFPKFLYTWSRFLVWTSQTCGPDRVEHSPQSRPQSETLKPYSTEALSPESLKPQPSTLNPQLNPQPQP